MSATHQAKVTYSNGKSGIFLSTDGWWFYEHRLPDPDPKSGDLEPFCYGRSWLESRARESPAIASIEFSEVPA